MPILDKEPNLYPDSLLREDENWTSDRHWWVLYTKARQEKALARNLCGQEIPFYLPLVKKRSVCLSRTLHSHVPLFSGYVFLYGSDDERVQSLKTNRVSRVLDVSDPEGLWHDLCQISSLIASEAPLTVESRLVRGNRVRVRRGPLQGLEGTVLARRGDTRLLVGVHFLQQGASVEIDDFLLEPLY